MQWLSYCNKPATTENTVVACKVYQQHIPHQSFRPEYFLLLVILYECWAALRVIAVLHHYTVRLNAMWSLKRRCHHLMKFSFWRNFITGCTWRTLCAARDEILWKWRTSGAAIDKNFFKIKIGLGNDLVLKGQQAITSWNDQVQWHIYASPGFNELRTDIKPQSTYLETYSQVPL